VLLEEPPCWLQAGKNLPADIGTRIVRLSFTRAPDPRPPITSAAAACRLYFRRGQWEAAGPGAEMLAARPTRKAKPGSQLLYYRLPRRPTTGDVDKALRYYKLAYDRRRRPPAPAARPANLLYYSARGIVDDNAFTSSTRTGWSTTASRRRMTRKSSDLPPHVGRSSCGWGRAQGINMFEKALRILPGPPPRTVVRALVGYYISPRLVCADRGTIERVLAHPASPRQASRP